MLSADNRLRHRRDFERVYRAGRSWGHPLVVLHALPLPSGQRVGFSVSKKVGNAVVRNRIRRRLREIVRAKLPLWKCGFDAVFVVRRPAVEAEFPELSEAVQELARRSGLVREPEQDPAALFTVRPARPRGS